MVDFKVNDDGAVLTFKDEHPTVVNSIRRIIIDEVPTMAIEEVEIVLNESPLYDETIAHRLGLIPIVTDLSSYNFKSDCKCGGIGCALCEVSMSINVESGGFVYSDEIKSNDPKIVPAAKRVPITKLNEGKKLEINVKAILGRGYEHAKWSPAHSYLRDEKGTIELVVEPYGQLNAKEIYNKAIDILVEKLDAIGGEI